MYTQRLEREAAKSSTYRQLRDIMGVELTLKLHWHWQTVPLVRPMGVVPTGVKTPRKRSFRVYRVLRKPHGKILWSCRTQTLGLLGEVNRAGGGSYAARERCRLCGMGGETLHHLLFECRCEGLSDTRLRFLRSVVHCWQDVFHAPCSWWFRGEGGGEGRQRLLLTPGARGRYLTRGAWFVYSSRVRHSQQRVSRGDGKYSCLELVVHTFSSVA